MPVATVKLGRALRPQQLLVRFKPSEPGLNGSSQVRFILGSRAVRLSFGFSLLLFASAAAAAAVASVSIMEVIRH